MKWDGKGFFISLKYENLKTLPIMKSLHHTEIDSEKVQSIYLGIYLPLLDNIGCCWKSLSLCFPVFQNLNVVKTYI